MIEVQVAQDHEIDRSVVETERRQGLEQHMSIFHDAVALAQARRKEHADPAFEQHAPPLALDQERATLKWDAAEFVGWRPAAPHRTRRVAEQRTAVQALGIAGNGAEFRHTRSSFKLASVHLAAGQPATTIRSLAERPR